MDFYTLLLNALLLLPCLFPDGNGEHGDPKPLRIGIAGLTHTHVHWILGREEQGDIQIVGIAESNHALAERYCTQHGLDLSLVYPSLEDMVAATHPEVVTAFNDTYHHPDVVRFCAPRGIHVMVEKPLAVDAVQAEEMVSLAQAHGIRLLTNYETTWYASTMEAYRLVHSEHVIGDIRKMVFYTGHQGPVEIGCNAEFLAWLTDPLLNGAGALTDFGCYGANLATYFLQGAIPSAVLCDTQHMKPLIYPRVEDEATIVLDYPGVNAQVVIMASWNWPFNRKEMEIYGTTGAIICKSGQEMRVMRDASAGFLEHKPPPVPNAMRDPFAYLYAVIREGNEVPVWSPSSMENNLLVMQVLDMARQDAHTSR